MINFKQLLLIIAAALILSLIFAPSRQLIRFYKIQNETRLMKDHLIELEKKKKAAEEKAKTKAKWFRLERIKAPLHQEGPYHSSI